MDANAVNAILGVNSQDLAYFRRGELSPAVRKQQIDAEKGCSRWLWIILLACIAIIAATFVLARGNWEAIIAISATPAIFGLGALAMLWFGRKPLLDNPENARVRSASGPAKISVSMDDGAKRYVLVVEKADFHIDRDLFEKIPEGANITVYYQQLDRFLKLLGVEAND